MTDYTPTTEEVRRRYMFGCWEEYQDTSGDFKTEFDCWLAEVKAEAWEEGLIDGKMVEWRGTRKNPYLQGEEQ